MSKHAVLVKFFQGLSRPLTGQELIAFRKADAAGFDHVAQLCANELGVTLDGSSEVITAS